jgi:hypothetical protein
MKTNNVRDLAIKLFGVYCFMCFVLVVPEVLYFSLSEPCPQLMPNSLASEIALGLSALLYLGLAYLFVFRTVSVIRLVWRESTDSDAAPLNVQAATTLSFWITLIGVFCFVRASARVLSELCVFARQGGMSGTYWEVTFLPQLIMLPISIFCMLRSKTIEGFIQRTAGKHGGTETQAHAD